MTAMRTCSSRCVTLHGVLAAAILCAGAPAHAQAGSAQSFRLTAIHFVGLDRLTQEQTIAATGLHNGDSITVAQIAGVQQNLAKSGVFENVAYRYTTHGGDITADFQVKESKNVLPCSFDNFVWFSQDELDQTIRRRVPLYAGKAPASGTTLQQVADVLTALLHSNGIEGTVDEIPMSPGVGAPPDKLLFQLKGVPMPVRSVKFPGASGLSEQQLTAASAEIIGQDFSTTHWSEYANFGLAPLYRSYGYLKVEFGQPTGRVNDTARDGSPVEVTVTLPVQEGLQYNWDKAEWSGNQQFPAQELDRLLAMKPRAVANAGKIAEGIAAVEKAYSTRGFIDLRLESDAKLDDAGRLATYDFSLTEGTQYRMGQIHWAGLPDKASAELTKSWKLKPGEVFDESYWPSFSQNVVSKKLSEMGIRKARVTVNRQVDKEKALVDLYVKFD